MDPLSAIGLAASIVQFVQFGITVADRLQELSKASPHDVPSSLRSISAQLPLLVSALSRTKSSASVQSLDFDTKCILKGMVSGCMEQVRTIEKMVDDITPKEGESVKSRIKKVFTSLKYDEKIWAVERNLQTYVQVLILHHVIDEKDVPEKFGEEAFFDVREKRVEVFVERKKIMKEVENTLRDVVWGKTKNPTVLILAGDKGTGKTQLILEYVHQSHDVGHFRTVFWIDASSLEDLNLGFESIYATIRKSTDGSREEKIRFVKQFFNDLWHPWLLVLDNYESKALYNEIMDFLPGQGFGGIVLITHNHAENGLGTVLHVPRFITQKDQDVLDSLLSQEVQRKNVGGIKDLVSQGANPNGLIWNEWPFLHRCALFGLESAASFLLSSGADPNPQNVKIRKPIGWASSSGSLPVVQLLLDHEDKVGLYNTPADLQAAFMTAAEEGHMAILKSLFARREINLNATNQYDETILQLASRKGNFEIVEWLLDQDILATNYSQGTTALLSASSGNFLPIVEILITEGKVSPNALDKQGLSPLAYAARSRNNEYKPNGLPLLSFLLSQNADPNFSAVGKTTPLNEACIQGHDDIVKVLLDHGADPTRDCEGWNTLTNAMKYNCPSTIDILLSHPPHSSFSPSSEHEKEAQEQEKKRKQWLESALLYAAQTGSRLFVQKLLSQKTTVIDINTTTPSSHPYPNATPLYLATLHSEPKTAIYLLRLGASQTTTSNNKAPIETAVEKGLETLVKEMIKHGADKDLKVGDNQDTLLMRAVENRKVGIVKVLVEGGADKEAVNAFGDSVEDLLGEMEGGDGEGGKEREEMRRLLAL